QTHTHTQPPTQCKPCTHEHTHHPSKPIWTLTHPLARSRGDSLPDTDPRTQHIQLLTHTHARTRTTTRTHTQTHTRTPPHTHTRTHACLSTRGDLIKMTGKGNADSLIRAFQQE